MKRLALLLHFTFCVFYFAVAQTAPGIQWQNTIGGSNDDRLYYIQQTNDHGYILGGSSNSSISGDKNEVNCDLICFLGCTYDYWIVKTDSLGNIQWQNTIGGNDYDELFSIQETIDGGYILGGRSYSDISCDKTENNNGQDDYWIVKLDSLGNIQWQNTIGGISFDDLTSLRQTTDKGYILGGYSNSDISGDKTENCIDTTCDSSQCTTDYWIVKTDSVGNIQWQNTIGGTEDDRLTTIEQTSDGGYILGGNSNSNISGDKTEDNKGNDDYWIVKTDSLGSIQWQNTIGGNDLDWLNSIQQIKDGYILGGFSSSGISGDKTENSLGGWDYWVIKIDSIGNIQWQNTIGGNFADILYSVNQTNDGGYILGGYSSSFISGDKTEGQIGGADYWIVKIDSIGNLQWQNTIGGLDNDYLYSALQTADGGYTLGGFSSSSISGDKTENNWDTVCIPYCTWDYWIVKLYPDTITSTINPASPTSGLQIFPNPFTEQFTVSVPITIGKFPIELKMFDVFGKEVLSQQLTTVNSKLQTANLPAGVYFLKVNFEIKKIIKIK